MTVIEYDWDLNTGDIIGDTQGMFLVIFMVFMKLFGF